MNQTTKNFKASEFACKCGCGFNKPDFALMLILEDVRKHFNAPVTINSSSRCKNHNESVGGSDKSQHVQGTAADITVKGVKPSAVYSYLDSTPYANLIGLGYYNNFTHVDARGEHARWMVK